MSKRPLPATTTKVHIAPNVARVPTVDEILIAGHTEMHRIHDDLVQQRNVLRERRALLANTMQGVDGQIKIIDEALRMIEANHGTG